MPTVHLIHGAFVSKEPGSSAIERLEQYIDWPCETHYYGLTVPPIVLLRNWSAVAQIATRVKSGDVIVGHSNGCLVAYDLVQELLADGITPSAVICINPALRRDTDWPDGPYRVLCIRNPLDWVVETGRIWSRLFQSYTLIPHGWGSAGRHGFTRPDTRVSNWTAPRKGWRQHVITDEFLHEWGPKLGHWIDRHA